MVCVKCQKIQKKTELATPGVKRKNDIYYGSPTTSATSGSSVGKNKTSATLGHNGIGKVSHTTTAGCAYLGILNMGPAIEQAFEQRCKESLRCICKLLHHVQDKDRAGSHLLPEMCL